MRPSSVYIEGGFCFVILMPAFTSFSMFSKEGYGDVKQPCLSAWEGDVIRKNILIVEDEESLLKLVSIVLTSNGYEVEGAMNGQSALESVANFKPNLVLLDIMLPEIDGFEVCQRIKDNPATKDIPVIMLTAKKSREDMARGEQVGADWYITKPFKSGMIIETVQKFIP
jgi:DNA-binding response OmpR family regulator